MTYSTKLRLMEELKEVYDDHKQPCVCGRCCIYRENKKLDEIGDELVDDE